MSRPTALVTGAASGLGAASARRLGEGGASVVVADVDDESGAAVAAEIGGRYVHLDVTDPEAWRALATDLTAGGIAMAHLNAGILTATAELPFLETPLERSLAVMRVNLDGVVLGVRLLAPLMIDGGGGAIVVTASLAGVIPYAGDPVYAATKHGVVGFVRSVAPQLRRAGVRLNAICPGGMDTPMVAGSRKELADAHDRPFLAPEVVADAVADRLASDESGVVEIIEHGQDVFRVEFPRHP
jgi:NAD(P)-dependent dehydrogenase (short-subunit alcohol dehydrogenase family)